MVQLWNGVVPGKAATQSATFSVQQLPYKAVLIKFIDAFCWSGASGIQSCNKTANGVVW